MVLAIHEQLVIKLTTNTSFMFVQERNTLFFFLLLSLDALRTKFKKGQKRRGRGHTTTKKFWNAILILHVCACKYKQIIIIIKMTKLRLHMIVQQLSERANKQGSGFDSYLCRNSECSEYLRTQSTIQLIAEGKRNGNGEFVCESCNSLLESSNDVFDNSNSVVEIKRRFNSQIQKLKNLLFELERAVSEERQKLEVIQQKAEERYEQFRGIYLFIFLYYMFNIYAYIKR
ncbi:hypothetical protein RFI_15280, partial [Reticulomyxa filosa]